MSEELPTTFRQTFLRSIRVGVLLLILPLSLLAQERPWESLDYPSLNPVTFPEIDRRVLENGATIYAMEDRTLPLVTINLIARGGRFLVPASKAGLDRLLEEGLMAGGTERLGPHEFRTLLEGRAATLSVSMGVTTTRIRLQFLREDMELLAPLLTELIQSPRYPESEVGRALVQAETAVSRQNEDPVEIARREFRKLLFGEESVLARVPTYETLDGLNRASVQELHEQIFQAPNLHIGISGDLDRPEMLSVLEDLMSGLPSGESVDVDVRVEPVERRVEESDSVVYLAEKRDINQSTVFLGHAGGRQSDEDLPAQELFNQIFGGGFSGRLFQNVRSEKGLAYAVFGSYGHQVHYPGIFASGALTRSETTVDAVLAVQEEIRRLREESVPDEELSEAVDRYVNQQIFEYEDRESQLLELMQNRLDGLPERWTEQLLESVPDVTAEEVRSMAHERIDPDKWIILIVGNPDELGESLDTLGRVVPVDISIPDPVE
ncbi:MAG: M16 family metallopeptidase [Bacteroidota bacterium]